jgi:phosphate transport system permease protein
VTTAAAPELLRAVRRLHARDLAALGAISLALTAGLALLAGTSNPVALVLLAAVVFGAVQSIASFTIEGRRQALDRLATLGVRMSMLIALTPLVALMSYTVARGLSSLSWDFLTHSMKGVGPLDRGGGAYHAIIGTLEQVLLAVAMAVPLGILTAVYVAEYGRGWFAHAVRFVTDVMTGVPSIVAGLFVFAFFVLPPLNMGPSGFAASLALSILMLPVVMRSTEEMIKLVPADLREAAYALGVPKWKTILRVVLPTASAGITTGVMLAIARVTGETAPLLLTAQLTNSINTDPFSGRQSGLGAYIYDQASSSGRGTVDRAWAAALTLVIIVLGLYAIARFLTRRNVLSR